ncbi:MAG TPA: tetratricopeptide repeat protein [Chthoniobacterales bacterium]|nr:tetratricopeptide repeat protein [Chthoniobacterales bacterium]
MPPAYRTWGFSLLLVALTAIAYMPAWSGKPIWNDDAHITTAELHSLHGLGQIWGKPGATRQYYPIVHSLFWIEHRLWGDSVLPYHLVNILLHGISAIVLWRILRQLNVPGAWLAAALFALHPVQVESVAWISELKNTLSGAFFLFSALIYLNFDETRKRVVYAAALALFLLGLMCKTAIAPLPAIILVVLWWKRGRISWKNDVLPLVPFFVIGIGAGLLTAWVERSFIVAQGASFNLSILQRCLIAGRDFWFYLFNLVWPQKLIFIYPRWDVNAAARWQYLFPAAALLLLALLWKVRARWRGPLAAALVFLGMLFPALGFLDVYPFVYSFVADHFQYLACIGPLTLAAAGITIGLDSFTGGKVFLHQALCTLLLLTLGVLTWRQSRQYSDIETLWRTTLARDSNCWMAHSNLGSLLLKRGNVDEGIEHFEKVLQIRPTNGKGYSDLGNALLQKGSLNRAMAQFQTAVMISPDDADTQNNLGGALLQQGQLDEAITYFEKALKIRPAHVLAHSNLGDALLQQGDIDAAIAQYQKTLELPFEHAESHYNIGRALRQNGQVDEAIAEYRTALELRPDYPNAHNNLANALRQKGLIKEAVLHYEKALQSGPGSILIQNNLAWLLATSSNSSVRNGARAVELAEKADRLSGGSEPVILHTLAAAYAENGQFSQAIETAQRALELADELGLTALADSLRTKIALYQAGSPYHETSPLP